MKRSVPTARSVAAEVLLRTWRDRAFASAVLDATLQEKVQLDARDRGLATELVYGVLRTTPWLAARLERYAPRGLGKLDPQVRAHLLVASYELFFLDRVPAFASVSSAVDLVREVRGERLAAFANAILRKVAREPKASRQQAAWESVPSWLAKALARALGDDGAQAFVTSGLAPMDLRIEQPEERSIWVERLREARPEARVEPGTVSPHAVHVWGGGFFRELPGWAERAWTVQEEGSQLVALAIGACKGEEVLDACAGRGNKTSLLARTGAVVDVADAHPGKLRQLGENLGRLNLQVRATYPVDWTVGVGEIKGPYDAVLVDAPCSGTGTLRRRPEVTHRRLEEELQSLRQVQVALVSRAAGLLKPRGRLVYAVCSVLCEEGEQVVEALRAECPQLVPAPFAGEEARALCGQSATLRLLPQVHGTDGYFLASFRWAC
jgi:16S rRNA (cytosine967-C5)-methyltransferase